MLEQLVKRVREEEEILEDETITGETVSGLDLSRLDFRRMLVFRCRFADCDFLPGQSFFAAPGTAVIFLAAAFPKATGSRP